MVSRFVGVKGEKNFSVRKRYVNFSRPADNTQIDLQINFFEIICNNLLVTIPLLICYKTLRLLCNINEECFL